jgi:uncharacterized protein (DUF934 family)
MPRLIRDNQVVEDEWTQLAAGADLPADTDKLLIAASDWPQQRQQIPQGSKIGVWIDGDGDIENISADLKTFEVLAINFPVFSDGRGYSLARLLRQRHRFQGELRAIGDVLPDQLYYMRRCGFDSFALRADRDPEAALDALSPFSESYQAATDQPVPLFRRR